MGDGSTEVVEGAARVTRWLCDSVLLRHWAGPVLDLCGRWGIAGEGI